ncbi:DNA (cytosine-5)-methyltransferase CMT2 [Dorcoceras hygrometricum]|uniref:Cytosine-specific methyltransferase n=1 Tax=Dorcoceras hygrometricum TaxID=472368 RepID=A0A2Z7B1I1_9LAMI|nr:DNA (cytosine-5)-methyltransferase CMT2 [Dorcoceras hygrometricum]
MRGEEASPHSFRSRKSPRFSSSVSYSTKLIAKPGSAPDANAAAIWALSLHVINPQPLKILFPYLEDNNSLRRSSRLTTNKYRSPIEERSSSGKQVLLPVSDLSRLRKSPRLSSSSSSPLALTSGNVKVVELSQLRSSPRFSSSSPSSPALTSGYYKTMKRCRSMGKADAGPLLKKGRAGFDDRSLRRLSACKKGTSKRELVALPEPGSGSLSESTFSSKRLSSRTLVMHVENEKDTVERSSSKKTNGDGFNMNEKRLRSRKVKYPSIESPLSFENKSLDRSYRKSPRLNPADIEPPIVHESASAERRLKSRNVLVNVGKETKGEKKGLGRSEDLQSQIKEYNLIDWPVASENSSVESGLETSQRFNEDVCGGTLKFEELSMPHIPSTKKTASFKQDSPLKSTTGTIEGMENCASSESNPPETKSDLVEFPDVFTDLDLNKCDSEVTNEKCLRRRKIQLKVGANGSSGEKLMQIEWHSSTKELSADANVKLEKNVVDQKFNLCTFVGKPIPEDEAKKRWQWRYELKSQKRGQGGWKLNAGEEDEIILHVDCHYAQAKVGSTILNIGDCVYVKGEGERKHVGRILEFFKTTEGEEYFRVQWFYRAEDTVLKDVSSSHDKKRLFYSTIMNDNILDCIISKVNVVRIPPTQCLKSIPIRSATFYYDMEYCVDYSSFRTLVTETENHDSCSLRSMCLDDKPITQTPFKDLPTFQSSRPHLALLDLYSGCGGMSTGLCVGAKLSGVNLVTKWAVDSNESACDSLKLNHPETQVRNESADNFLELLRRWEQLCKLYVCDIERTLKYELDELGETEDNGRQCDEEEPSEEYEVSNLVDICYGDPSENGKGGLHFKVRWKGYDSDEDTWEPIEGLSNCHDRIQEFVRNGFKSKILPLPGDVDVICGGPPCQGISGYNRHRNFDSPLDDERNRQVVVFMDIVTFLKPKYVLMENVVDIIRFDNGSIGRYALSRLVDMKYQARLGTIASGCYGLPQFRLRVFIWGANPSEKLPQFPLPTHDVVVRYWPPIEFERNIVAYNEGQHPCLEDAVLLSDSISDLPAVTNDENREEMEYLNPPETEFQRYIRLTKQEMTGLVSTTDSEEKSSVLYDHRPSQLRKNDYLRVCQVPHRKGANFRDLPGLVVGKDNVVRRDPTKEPVMLPTGRPLIPDSALSFEQGKSKKPFARLWWDETVSTIVTFPYVQCMAVLHPEQDRVLTIRECARLQGFPDFYRFCGTIKERYCQIGNAVSVPVARALGYALGMAYHKVSGDEPLMTLPPKFFSQQHSMDEKQ